MSLEKRIGKLEQWASEVANRAPSGPAWTRAFHRAYGDATPWDGRVITDEEFERALDEVYGPEEAAIASDCAK